MNSREGIKSHPFFASCDWNAILRKEVHVPFIPHLDGPLDYTYFDRSLVRVGVDSRGDVKPALADSTCAPQHPPSEMELQLRIRQERERQQVDNPRGHVRTRTPSLELDTRYLGFEYSCDQ